MTREEFDAAVEGCRIERDVHIQQCQGGYVLTGTLRYVNGIGGLVASVEKRGVAAFNSNAVSMVSRFLLINTFVETCDNAQELDPKERVKD